MAPISPVPTTNADVPQTIMAIASCVKLLAEPGPPPGPWDAKAASAHTSPVATKAAAMAQVCIFLLRDDAMTISCDDKKLQKIRTPV